MEFSIRPAAPNDTSTIAAITIEGWREAYLGLIAQDTLDSLSLEKRTEGWENVLKKSRSKVIVAEENENIVGITSFGHSRYEKYGAGEIYALYVLRSYHRQGIGSMLIKESLEQLSQGGFLPTIVLALKGNTPAQQFYEKVGFESCGHVINPIDGRNYEEIVYRYE